MSGIMFNGKEYASREDMPPAVRAVYDEVTAVLQGGQKDGVSGWARSLDDAQRVLSIVLRAILVCSGAVVAVGGTVVLVNMDEGSASQGGRFYLGVAMLLVLGGIVNGYVSAARRAR